MGLLSWFTNIFDSDTSEFNSVTDFATHDNDINPANGLPMVGCLDVEGNPYGTDSSHDIASNICDDPFNSSMDCSTDDTFSSSFDDSFSSGCGSDDW